MEYFIKMNSAGNAMSHRRAKNVCLMKRDMLSVRALISWVNDALDADVKDLQELCTGAIYCQLMHRLFPKDVAIAKVHFYCDLQREFEANYRILRNSFTNLDLNKEIPVRKLQYGRGHYEFANWFHKFYMVNWHDKPYDAVQVRKGSRIGLRERQPEKINRRHTQMEKTPRNLAKVVTRCISLNLQNAAAAARSKQAAATPKPHLAAVAPKCTPDENFDKCVWQQIGNLAKKCELVQRISTGPIGNPVQTLLKMNSILFGDPLPHRKLLVGAEAGKALPKRDISVAWSEEDFLSD